MMPSLAVILNVLFRIWANPRLAVQSARFVVTWRHVLAVPCVYFNDAAIWVPYAGLRCIPVCQELRQQLAYRCGRECVFGSMDNRAVGPLGTNRPNGEARTNRRARGLAALGLTLALAGGILGSASPAAFAALQATTTPTPGAAACRTVLQGDQTTSSLTDITQFVPVSELGGGAAATPASTQTATATATPPAVTSAATPIPADSSVSNIAGAETLRSLAFSIVNCTSQGDFAALGDLVTTNYLSETFAGGDKLSRTDLLALASVTVVPQQSLIAFDNVEVNGDTGSAEVIYTSGSQLLHQQWNFITDESGDWVLDSQTSLAPLALEGSVTTNVTINNGIKTNPREVDGGNVVLLGENTEKVDHEMLVLRLPSGASTDLLLQQPGPGLPDGVQFIGQMTVPANGEAILPLINLAPGNYVVVCMLLDDNGAPYLADGYKARLIVQ
jgi:hypothetical protein